jgi:hypothetical protein
VVSLELLTVLFDGPLAVYICYCLSRQDPKVYIWMIVLATAEIYGGAYGLVLSKLVVAPNYREC